MSELLSTKKELMQLRRVAGRLSGCCTQGDGVSTLRAASALWDRWLCVLEAAQEWAMWSEDLKQDWKFISEEVSVLFQHSDSRVSREVLWHSAPSLSLALR